MQTSRSAVPLRPVAALPNPMIRPPRVVVVWNQASVLNCVGAPQACGFAAKPLLPLNCTAVSVVPVTAPGRP